LNTFINGVSFWENPHTVFSSGVTPDIIQTANVITGGFPAEYGNRFGGVIDVVTKSGLSMNNEGSVTLGVGMLSGTTQRLNGEAIPRGQGCSSTARGLSRLAS
jgi:outer membrane receptor protein involved in Fe transport